MLDFIKPLIPTWSRPQARNLAQLAAAIHQRHSLVISEVAREYPSEPGEGPHDLRYRVKRVWRFINNRLLPTNRLMDSLYHLSLAVCTVPGDLLPVLLDTTFFEPFALLTASVPVGGRAIPVRWVTYHRYELQAVFATDGGQNHPAEMMLSENLIERRLVDEIWARIAPRIRAALVGDRGFASAEFFEWLKTNNRPFVIRFQPDTYVTVPDGRGGMTTGAVKDVVPIEAGQRRWIPGVLYRKDEAVEVNVLVVYDVGQEEPWYLATTLSDSQEVEQLYRWRMREEREYKDCKDQILLGKKGTRMTVQNTVSAARLLDALMVLHWFVALVGLQALQDLPAMTPLPNSKKRSRVGQPEHCQPSVEPHTMTAELPGPAVAPEPKPRVEGRETPYWLRRFQARGPISYTKLGLEFLRLPDIAASLARLVAWIADKLRLWEPLWTRRQARYRAWLTRFG